MIRVIGLGSPFGDDQAGWWVVENMRGCVPPPVDLVRLDRPGATLINWLDGVNHVYIIDAVGDASQPPGRVLPLNAAQLDRQSQSLTSHQLNLADTLQLAKALGCLPAQVNIVGITIGDVTAPSATVQAAARLYAEKLAGEISAEIDADSATG